MSLGGQQHHCLQQQQQQQSESTKIKICAFDLSKITDFNTMPNCVSTFAMLFLFDIFKPTELQRLTDKTLKMLMKIKDLYKPQISLNETNLLAFAIENLFLNYFALAKHRPSAHLRIGFLNYLISTACLLEYLRNSNHEYFLRLVVLRSRINSKISHENQVLDFPKPSDL